MKEKANINYLTSIIYNPFIRGVFYQAVLITILGFSIYTIYSNVTDNLNKTNTSSGFEYLSNPANIAPSQSLISYSYDTMTWITVLKIGILNSLLVAILGIIFATILGVMFGVARLSSNWLLAKSTLIILEVVRNIPILLQIFFWYSIFLSLPAPKNSLNIFNYIFLSNRGIYMPYISITNSVHYVVGLLIASIFAFLVYKNGKQHNQENGKTIPFGLIAFGIIFAAIILPLALGINQIHYENPELQRFGFKQNQGLPLYPELLALLVALSTYTAVFIGEIVRAGIISVKKGQIEAALSLGLKKSTCLRLVISPQALRLIIPPLASQYLNITKNSSLAIAIGYPDIMSLVGGTTVNVTGQALEPMIIVMAFYCTASILTAILMNIYSKYTDYNRPR